ncbi:MAG: hypothetical protein KBD76_06880 [Bacteriovorax sp.]|jgi:hypothetical protein|nr:hypothetical protein [Bacteriovorax sp.]
MKKFITAIIATLMATSIFATEVIKAENDSNLQILDLVIGVKQTYSQTSELEAKVIELLGGDGLNPTRLVLILGTGNPMEEKRIFSLGVAVYEVTRITFLDKDLIVINYFQDDIDEEGKTSTVKRSMKIQVLRQASGELSGEIKIN